MTLVLVRDDRMLDAYTYTIGLAGLILLLLPIVPGLGRTINGARLWVAIGPISFQPAEFGKVLIVIFLASYLADKREMLAAGSGRFSLPRAKDLGPLMIAWATSLAVLFLEKDLGASLLYFAVFVVMLWIASGRPMFLIVGPRAVRGRRLDRLPGAQPRAAARRLLAERAQPRQGLSTGVRAARAGVVRDGVGRHRRHRARSRVAHADPVRRHRLHLRGDR